LQYGSSHICATAKDISNVFFFFSSRRRHTSFSRDWSSDVCSSDLTKFVDGDFWLWPDKISYLLNSLTEIREEIELGGRRLSSRRSEEGRVGKEGITEGAAGEDDINHGIDNEVDDNGKNYWIDGKEE